MSDPEDSVNLVKLMCHEFFWGSGHTSSDHQSWARQRKRLGPRFELTVARCWDGFLCSKVMALLHQTMGSSWAKKLTMFDDVWWCLMMFRVRTLLETCRIHLRNPANMGMGQLNSCIFYFPHAEMDWSFAAPKRDP
jgi:hypothetical protein